MGRTLSSYAVGLVAGLILLPGACSVAVIAWKLGAGDSSNSSYALLFGTLIGVAVWLLVAVPLRRFGSPRDGNPGVFRELDGRENTLRQVSATLNARNDPEAMATLQAALDSARAALSEGESQAGSAWASGAGYLFVFTMIHQAEQALTELLPEPDVVRQALLERSSLQGSEIAGANERIARLERAIHALSAQEYLPEVRTTEPPADKRIARAVVRDAQATVDDFRDSRRGGLVRARNRLFATVAVTGMIAYSGLGLALLAGAETTQIVAAGTFYLIGATVGLFRQLRQAASADTVTEEDFGLGIVRLVGVPLASGLAAIGGVVLTAYLTALNSGDDVQPLAEVFDVSENPLGLISAAVFGFTPSLLASGLQSRADKWKEELKSTAPGEKGTS